jgi:hypothetical protein
MDEMDGVMCNMLMTTRIYGSMDSSVYAWPHGIYGKKSIRVSNWESRIALPTPEPSYHFILPSVNNRKKLVVFTF